MKLYLITHAATQPVPSVAPRRWTLSEAGQQQAQTLAALPFWEEVDRIILSTEAKTRLTVQPVLDRYELPTIEDSRFDELRASGWIEGDYGAVVKQAFAQPDQPVIGRETARAAQARMVEGINDLGREFASETLCLVGHGLTLSLYRSHLLGQTHVRFGDWQQLSFAALALADPIRGVLLRDFEAAAGEMPRG